MRTILNKRRKVWMKAALVFSALLLVLAGCGGGEKPVQGDASSSNNSNESKIVWVLGHLGSSDHTYQVASEILRDKLDEYTNGVIQLNIKGAGALGDEASMLEMYNTGDMQMGIHISGAVAAKSEQFGFLSIPFLFDSDEHWKAVMHSEEARDYWNNVLSEQKAGFRVGAIGTEGARNVYTKQPISELKEFSGLKMRILENPIMATVWSSIGSIPVSLPFPDVYSALQAGLIDAGENSPTGYTHFAHQEVAKYYMLTRHEISTAWLMVAENNYNALSPELQQQVDRALADMEKEWYQIAKEAEIAELDKMESELGVVISEPSTSLLEELRSTVAPVVENLAAEENMGEFVELVRSKAK